MRPRALILLNPQARGGTAAARFARVEPVLRAAFRSAILSTDLGGNYRTSLFDALADGVRVFIAAGGDGTVHALVNDLAQQDEVQLSELLVGAVGLGSSNDFHKPITPRTTTTDGVPLRINLETAAPRDLIRVRFTGADGRQQRSLLAAVSASIGATAAANAFFNGPDRLLHALDRHWTDGAILYSAGRTLARWRNLPATLTVNGERLDVAISNLSVTKTPYLSGSMRYDMAIAPDDGQLGVLLCRDMSRTRLARTMAALYRGRFAGLPGTSAWHATHVEVELAQPADLELDGEVMTATRATFDVVAEGMMVCGT